MSAFYRLVKKKACKLLKSKPDLQESSDILREQISATRKIVFTLYGCSEVDVLDMLRVRYTQNDADESSVRSTFLK